MSEVVASKAIKRNKYNICRTWHGWISKDVLHITSSSGARRRKIWHFPIIRNAGKEMFFKNTTVTADCWTVIPAKQEKDPYGRILRQCKQSKKFLHRHQPGEVVYLKGRWAYLHCHVPGESSFYVSFDSDETIFEGPLINVPGGHFQYQDWEVTLSKSTWAVVRKAHADSNGRVRNFIEALHIWGEPDIEEVASAVRRGTFGRS